MKKYLWFLTAVLLPVLSQAQGWVNITVPGITESITGVSFISRDTGFIVTFSGRFARTNDGGKTWNISTIGRTMMLEDVFFIDNRHGLACARKGHVFRTNDGGKSWSHWTSGDTLHYFSSLDMKDSLTAYVVGLQRKADNPLVSVAYRTIDGGKTWTSQLTKGMGYAQLMNANHKLYLLSYATLHSSTDFGKTWTSRQTTDGSPGRSVSLNGRTGIIGGIAGMRSYSSDSGKTWQLAETDSSATYIAAQLISEQTGYLGGSPSRLMVTNDGGKTWGQELPARQFDILAFCLVDDRLYAVGSSGGIGYKKIR